MSAPPTEGSGFLHLLGDHWLALLGFLFTLTGALYFVYHTLKRTIPDLAQRIRNIEEAVGRLDGRATELGFAKRKDLYDDNGRPRFQPHEACNEIREACDNDRQMVKQEIFAKLGEVQDQLNTNGHTMNKLLAKVDAIMAKDERQERREDMAEMAETIAETIFKKINKSS